MTRAVTIVTAAVAIAACSVAGSAAGPPSVEDSGRFLIVEGELFPPQPGTASRPQGVAVEFESLNGNIRTGEPPSLAGAARTRIIEIRTPRGTRFNHTLFPKCRLEVLDRSGPAACPRGSRIGSGTTIADARPLLPDFVRVAGAQVYNGRGGDGRPAILVWAKVAGITVTLAQTVRPARPGFGPTFFSDNGANQDDLAPFATVAVALSFPKRAVVVNGKRRYLWEAPTTCRGSWLFQQVNTSYDGSRLVANHRAPCG